ncbi:MAG: hypothetical protein P8H03_04890, partial [Emcibacteraceae bacterium]|nr:hypothetical protein [Emcibacteraceae bacterium]
GFMSKFATARAAKTSMIVGPFIFYLLVFAYGTEVQVVTQNLFNTTEEIHFLHFLALVFLITSFLMVIISKIWPEKYVERKSNAVKVDLTPWKYAKFMSILVSVIVILTYILLAK